MPRLRFFVCLAALTLLPAFSAESQLSKPKENLTQLAKPTISYNSYDDYEIRLMDWDGKNDRLWLHGGNVRFSSGMNWSPDGKRAAIATFDNADWSYTPYVINLKTGRSKNLMDLGIPDAKEGYAILDWSPDGQWLLMLDAWYVTLTIIHAHLYKLNVQTGTFIRLTKKSWMFPESAAWSPDGKRIAFSALSEPDKDEPGGEKRDIFVMNDDGSRMVNITKHPAYEEFPTWSPDGKKIAFRAYRDNQDLEVERPVGRAELYVMSPDGADVERLTRNAGWEGEARWSADSQWLVYRAGPVNADDPTLEGVYRMHVMTKKTVLILQERIRDPDWVMAGKSRFLSVDPSDKKKARWGALKAAAPPAPQETAPNAE